MGGIWRHRTVEAACPRRNVNAHPEKVCRCFRGFLEAHPLTVVDVGARGGATPEIAPMAPVVRLIALEADADAAHRLREQLRVSGFRAVDVIEAAAGAGAGRRTLHITRDPAKSSALEPNGDVLERYGDAGAYVVTERRELETRALGEILAEHGIESVDLLKLDVQGSELEVLRGAAPQPLDRLLCLEAEVEFVELYRGQALFRDVDEFLGARGFELFDLSRSFANYGGKRWQPYGRGQIQFADAHYLRTCTEDLSSVSFGKLVFLASYYGFTDYAFSLYSANEERIRELGEPHARLFRKFFAKFSRRRPEPLQVLATLSKTVLDRLLFHYLCWRRWNGLKTDTDRAYPFR